MDSLFIMVALSDTISLRLDVFIQKVDGVAWNLLNVSLVHKGIDSLTANHKEEGLLVRDKDC